MVHKRAAIAFGGMWVWPGGRVDPGDRVAGADEMEAARRACVREAAEEAGVVVDPAGLVPFCHFTPPMMSIKRFATWFFVGDSPVGVVTIDDGEIQAHRWMSPADAIRRHRSGEIELAPPTWITLARLNEFKTPAEVIAYARANEPMIFCTRIGESPEGPVALYAGDAGYEATDPSIPGDRHRLIMSTAGWTYTRPDGTIVTT